MDNILTVSRCARQNLNQGQLGVLSGEPALDCARGGVRLHKTCLNCVLCEDTSEPPSEKAMLSLGAPVGAPGLRETNTAWRMPPDAKKEQTKHMPTIFYSTLNSVHRVLQPGLTQLSMQYNVSNQPKGERRRRETDARPNARPTRARCKIPFIPIKRDARPTRDPGAL
eukprot:gene25437-biopygen20989